MSKQDDGLFLFEVLVDRVVLKSAPCFTDKDFKTCVSIECPSVAPLEICDDDPDTGATKSGGTFSKSFKSGKSCLFSLKQSDISQAMSKFPIKIQVFKTLPCGCIPTKILLGEATIDMTKEFVTARQKYLESPATISYEALCDYFEMTGTDGSKSGGIMMFLRISCFGNMIVTKFQGGGGPPSLGGERSGQIVDRSCQPQNRLFQTPDDPCACGAAQGHPSACASQGAGVGGGNAGTCRRTFDPYNSMPCTDADDPCFCSNKKPPPKDQMACRNTDQYCLHVPKGRTKEFEEIGTKVNGNELKIKVPASASVIKKLSQTHCSMQRPYVKKTGDPKDEGPCVSPCGKNQISLALPSEPICCEGVQPQGTQFTCTTEGCTQASKHGQLQSMNRPPPEDFPNQDCYVLKVCKNALEGDRKCKLELELVTPKGPERSIPKQKTNRNTQSEFECLCGVRRLRKTPSPCPMRCCS